MSNATTIAPDPLQLLSFSAMVRYLRVGKAGESLVFARQVWDRVPKVVQNEHSGRAKTMWPWVEATLLEMAEEDKACAAVPVVTPCVLPTRPARQAATTRKEPESMESFMNRVFPTGRKE